MSKPFVPEKGLDFMIEAGIKDGDWQNWSKASRDALIGDPRTHLWAKVYLIGVAHTQGYAKARRQKLHPEGLFQVELAVKLHRGRIVPMWPRDISQEIVDLTRLYYERAGHEISDEQAENFRPDKQQLNRALEYCENGGYGLRAAPGLQPRPIRELPLLERQKLGGSGKLLLYFFVRPLPSKVCLPEVVNFDYLPSADDGSEIPAELQELLATARRLGIRPRQDYFRFSYMPSDDLQQKIATFDQAEQTFKGAKQELREALEQFLNQAPTASGDQTPAVAYPKVQPEASGPSRPQGNPISRHSQDSTISLGSPAPLSSEGRAELQTPAGASYSRPGSVFTSTNDQKRNGQPAKHGTSPEEHATPQEAPEELVSAPRSARAAETISSPEVETVLETMPRRDRKGAEEIIRRCRQKCPQATAVQIAEAVRDKGRASLKKDNPVAYLLTYVPQMFEAQAPRQPDPPMRQYTEEEIAEWAKGPNPLNKEPGRSGEPAPKLCPKCRGEGEYFRSLDPKEEATICTCEAGKEKRMERVGAAS